MLNVKNVKKTGVAKSPKFNYILKALYTEKFSIRFMQQMLAINKRL